MKFKRSLETRAFVDLVPMIDVVFQLILFFLVSTTFALLPGITLDLPQSSTAEGKRTIGVTITVEETGSLWLNDMPTQFETLDEELEQIGIGLPKDTIPVSLEADEKVASGTIVRVLDSLRRTGYSAVNLRTRE